MKSIQPQSSEQAPHKLIFIGGLHASGTSLLHRLICMHPSVSGFSNTRAPEDEGQHLQNLYSTAAAHGGPGRFVFDEASHLTDANQPLVEKCSAGLWKCWAPYWDLSKPVLVEKSPPNIIRSRFLEAVFPGARFIFVIRHPIPVAGATQKWTKQPLGDLLQHWVLAHQTLLNDLTHVKSWTWFRYEDLTADPQRILTEIFRFADLSPVSPNRLFVSGKAASLQRKLAPLERPLKKLLRSTGLSRSGSREIIVDGNTKYLDGTNHRIDLENIKSLEVIGKFGYELSPPYYKVAPGMGRVVSSVNDTFSALIRA
jgi:sulfotransferase family protein